MKPTKIKRTIDYNHICRVMDILVNSYGLPKTDAKNLLEDITVILCNKNFVRNWRFDEGYGEIH